MGRKDKSKYSDANEDSDEGAADRTVKTKSRRERDDRRSIEHKQRRRDEDRLSSASSTDSGDSRDFSNGNGSDHSSLDSRHRRHRRKNDKKRKKKDANRTRDKDDKRSKKESKRKGKKEKKKRKRDSKHEDSKRKKRSKEDDNLCDNNNQEALARNYALAKAITNLLTAHPSPAMATDTLPLVLLQLGKGQTLDLSLMTDTSARQGLAGVLKCLQPFGVEDQAADVWKWVTPGGKQSTDERLLMRIVRTLLNEIGVTMEAVEQTERRQQEVHYAITTMAEHNAPAGRTDETDVKIEQITMDLLGAYAKQTDHASSSLPGELGGLCQMILDGENIALDGLPDASLREALESLFQQCGLEKSEMQNDINDSVDEDDSEENEVAMGYGLPETSHLQQLVRDNLRIVVHACQKACSPAAGDNKQIKRVVKGPMRMPQAYQPPEESSSEDEGPAPVGVARAKGSSLSNDELKQLAALRARQLKGAITGQEELMSTDPNVREEWMLVPGKFDFLSSIKSGNPLKNRTFQNQSTRDREKAANQQASRPVDPKVQAELDAIMDAHQSARGPTLVEQHRLKKEQERQAKGASRGSKQEWKWDRDSDLDKDRRVDKNALHMVLGGAQDDLKKKFQAGF